MGYTGFHTIYYHGFLKDQLGGLVERLAAMEQRYLYSITYERVKEQEAAEFGKRFTSLIAYFHTVGVIDGLAMGIDCNGSLNVVLDTKQFDRAADGMKFEGLACAPKIQRSLYAEFDEVVIDLLLNVREIDAFGTMVEILNSAVFWNHFSNEVTRIA